MILYEECKHVDKVRGKQKTVEGKLRDQCMLCEFYEVCNSCFFFGSSNDEKEAAIADMISSQGTQNLDVVNLNTVLTPSYRDSGLYVHSGVSGSLLESQNTARIEALRQRRGK